jgi:hypothetical protein
LGFKTFEAQIPVFQFFPNKGFSASIAFLRHLFLLPIKPVHISTPEMLRAKTVISVYSWGPLLNLFSMWSISSEFSELRNGGRIGTIQEIIVKLNKKILLKMENS